MINKQKFLTWIRNPQSISTKDMDDLKEVANSYPFCNIAHSLLAKGYHNTNSDEFTERLQKAAIYSANRSRLKQLIENSLTPLEASSLPRATERPKEKETIALKEPGGDQNTINSPEETDTEKLHRELQENLQQLHQHKNIQKERIKNQVHLIDRFIEKDPKIAKPDLSKQEQKQEDLSLKSQKIKDDIASENLALILARQGKTQKAVNIYQKLILKFPEKKAYFASRIEELKKK